jgi:hypothetical protein
VEFITSIQEMILHTCMFATCHEEKKNKNEHFQCSWKDL